MHGILPTKSVFGGAQSDIVLVHHGVRKFEPVSFQHLCVWVVSNAIIQEIDEISMRLFSIEVNFVGQTVCFGYATTLSASLLALCNPVLVAFIVFSCRSCEKLNCQHPTSFNTKCSSAFNGKP